MDERDLVRSHYARPDLSGAVFAALAARGVDVAHLSAHDLYPVDQLHAGFAAATEYAVRRLGLRPGDSLLDVGCGIGGPSRLAATITPARVTGVDLSSDFVGAARRLTERVGLAGRVTHDVAAGAALPFEDHLFDAAMMIHVGMNIADKRAVFAEVHRVLTPGSRFVIFEQMRVGPGELSYPMPWADDERSSFVESPQSYTSYLIEVGFSVDDTEDRTAATLDPPAVGPDDLSPRVIFGPDFTERIANNLAASRAGVLGAVLLLASAGQRDHRES
ncbi:class I SAM-dependent methyltransferase [Microlunatus soli]|uniref:Methyltransferase domain-containing protein n=1 Tax=Microlunatus soli TaxID=630515 RepID=A0A1H1R9C7_9ACTN|nr:methyltransferase domain-containing protein [Microlunatus soli]SDS32303.1 Methyltransferase domain-containing protein [Microlunatus soli]